MKQTIYYLSVLLLFIGIAACSDSSEGPEEAVTAVAPEVSSFSIGEGTTDVDPSIGEITIYTTAPVALSGQPAITLTDDQSATVALTPHVANRNIRLSFGQLQRDRTYTLTVPVGALRNAHDPAATNLTTAVLHFKTPLSPYVPPTEVTVNPAASLNDAAASQAAKDLYAYIRNDLFLGGRMAVGTMAKYTTGITEAEWVNQQTGRYPALHCFDLMNLTGKQWLEDYNDLLPNAQAWHDAGGIVAVMWHWRDPSKATNEFYSETCKFRLSRIIASANADGTYTYATESAEYKAVMEDIAQAKAKLQLLADAGIPVLWRPLHEARGTWFWWGNDGADACKALWQLLHREMADLHNLIWVWTVQADNKFHEAREWYPGDALVDIAGVDIYKEQHKSFIEEYNFVADVSGCTKVIALTECGAMPDVTAMQRDGACWAWCMPWYGEHSQDPKYNGPEYWKRMMTGDYAATVIDRSEVAY